MHSECFRGFTENRGQRMEPMNSENHSEELMIRVPLGHQWFRTLPFMASVLALILLLFSGSCSRPEANQYDPTESNIMIAAVFAAKDGECGTTHTFTSILVFPADRANVEACMYDVLQKSCTDWNTSDPSPDTCQFIGIQFQS